MANNSENNWGYPTSECFDSNRPSPPQQKEGTPEVKADSSCTSRTRPAASSRLLARLAVFILVSAGAAWLVMFPLKEQASALIQKIPRISIAEIKHSESAAIPAAPGLTEKNQETIYHCGSVFKTAPGQGERCERIEIEQVQDSRGNQYITHNW